MADGVWWARSSIGPPTDRRIQVRGYTGGRHPDGAIVDVDPAALEPDSDGRLLAVGEVSSDRVNVRSIQLPGGQAPPGLWWLFLPETAASSPAVNLVAFDGLGQPPGAVVDSDLFRSLPLHSSDQAGAVRWWPSTGQVHQIYVQPTRRREGIGTALLLAVGTFRVLREWAPLWASGQRTDLGEALFTAPELSVVQSRAQSRTHRLPPMTPADKEVGVPRRQLMPDPPRHPQTGGSQQGPRA